MVDARCRSFPGSPRQFMRRGGASIEITHKVCCVLPHKEEGNATALVSVKESLYTHESIGRRLSHAVSSQTVPCYNSLIGVYALCRTRHKVFPGKTVLVVEDQSWKLQELGSHNLYLQLGSRATEQMFSRGRAQTLNRRKASTWDHRR